MTIKIHEQKKAASSSKNPLSNNFRRRKLKLKKIKRSLFYRWYMKNIYNAENKYKYPNINLNEDINAINEPNKETNFTIEKRVEDRLEIRENTLTNENNLNNFANPVDKYKIEHLSYSFISKNPSPNTPFKFLELMEPLSNSILNDEGNNNNVEYIDNERPFSLLNDSTSPYNIDNNPFHFLVSPIGSNVENCFANQFNKVNFGFIFPLPPIICSCCNSFNNNFNDDRNSNNINFDINNNIIFDRNSGSNNRINERNINNNNLVNNSDISNRNVNENNIINNGNTNNLENNNNNNTYNINNNLNQNNRRNSTFIDLLGLRRRRTRRRLRINLKEIKINLLTKKIIVKDISKLDDNKNSCVICLEKFKNHQKVYKLDCTHIFHIRCLNKEIKFRPKCPCCRKNL